jgi:hypothetical protein
MNKQSSKFLVGLLFGVLIGAIIWYWQKSTSAENGALALLDRLAAAESKLRDLRLELSGRVQGVELPSVQVRSETAAESDMARDDLTEVKGVGPVFERRLQAAGISSIRQLAECDIAAVASALDVSHGRAEAIVQEAGRAIS